MLSLTRLQSDRAKEVLANESMGHAEKAANLAELGLIQDAEREFDLLKWPDPANRELFRKQIFGQ